MKGTPRSAIRLAKNAVRRKRAGLLRFRPVQLERPLLGLVRHIHQFGYRGLHAVRHFVLSDACMDFRIAYLLVSQLD